MHSRCGVIVLAHKNVLLAASDYFATGNGCPEWWANAPVTPKFLITAISFCYTNVIDADESTLWQMFTEAHNVGMKRMAAACQQKIINDITVSNVIETVKHAEQLPHPYVIYRCGYFIKTNFEEIVSKEPGICLLSTDHVSEILKCDYLRVSHEDVTFEALYEWIMFDVENRQIHSSWLISYLRLSYLSKAAVAKIMGAQVFKMVHSQLCDLLKKRGLPSYHSTPRDWIYKTFIVFGKAPAGPRCLKYNSFTTCFECCRLPIHYMFSLKKTNATFKNYIVAILDDGIGCYDFLLNSSVRIKFPAIPRNEFTIVVLNGSLYLIGGKIYGDSVDMVERFDSISHSWKILRRMGKCRDNCQAVVARGCIIVGGGYNNRVLVDTIEGYDPVTDTWIDLPPFVTPGFRSFGVLNDKIYAIGEVPKGFTADKITPIRRVESYDFDGIGWKPESSLSYFEGQVRILEFENKLCVLGGEGNIINSVAFYDPVSKIWRYYLDSLTNLKNVFATVLPAWQPHLEHGCSGSGCCQWKVSPLQTGGMSPRDPEPEKQ